METRGVCWRCNLRRLTNERDVPVASWPRCGDRQRRAATGSANAHRFIRKGKSVAIVFAGIGLAKNVLAVCPAARIRACTSLRCGRRRVQPGRLQSGSLSLVQRFGVAVHLRQPSARVIDDEFDHGLTGKEAPLKGPHSAAQAQRAPACWSASQGRSDCWTRADLSARRYWRRGPRLAGRGPASTEGRGRNRGSDVSSAAESCSPLGLSR